MWDESVLPVSLECLYQWVDTNFLRKWSVMLESPSLFPPYSSPPPLQVLIPSVKLDYSHVQSRCGSLDRRGYSAGGGNVSLVPQIHCLSVNVSVIPVCCVVFFSVAYSFSTLLYSFSVYHSPIKAAVLVLFTRLVFIDTAFSSGGLCPVRNFETNGWMPPLQHIDNMQKYSSFLMTRAW